jgi:hypothetical protein
MLPTPALMQRARASSVEARVLSRCEWRPATLTPSMNLEARVALRAHSCHGIYTELLDSRQLVLGLGHALAPSSTHSRSAARASECGPNPVRRRCHLVVASREPTDVLAIPRPAGASAASGARNHFLRSAVSATFCGQLRTSFRPREKRSPAACSAYRSTHALPHVAPPLTRSCIRW